MASSGSITLNPSRTLVDEVDAAVQQWPHAEALVYDDGEHIHRLTYSDVSDRSDKVCDWLRRAGVLEEIVAVALLPGANLPSVLTGVMKVPAAFLPISLHSASAALMRTLARLKVRVVLIDPSLVQMIAGRPVKVDVLDDLDIAVVFIGESKGQCNWKTPLAYIITTSGSTGEPKVVRVPHTCILPNITHIRSIYKMSPCDVSIIMSPLTFDPSIVEIFVALTSGSRVLLVPDVVKMAPSLLTDIIRKHAVTVMQVTPSVIWSLGLDLMTSTVLSASTSLRVLSLGGEACPRPAALRTWRCQGNTTTFVNLYGITEVSSWAMFHVLTDDDLSSQDELPLGTVLQSTCAEVRNDLGKKVTQGEGELFIGGASRTCFLDDESHPPTDGMRGTGDRVMLDSRSRIWYRGRIDRQLKRHGMRLDLDTLEKVAMETKDVCHCTAFVSDHEGVLHIVVQPSRPSTSDEHTNRAIQCCRVEKGLERDLRQLLNQRLPTQYSPDHVWAVRTLPYTCHGKVDRDYIQDMVAQYQDNLGTQLPKKTVEDLWKDCLQMPGDHTPCGTDTWLACGGDSFSAVRFLNSLPVHITDLQPSLLEIILTKTYRDVLSSVEADFDRIKHSVVETSGAGENLKDGICFELGKADSKSKRVRESGDAIPNAKRQSVDIAAQVQVSTAEDNGHWHCAIALSRANHRVHICSKDKNQCCATMDMLDIRVNQDQTSTSRFKLIPKWSWDTGKCIDASPLLLITYMSMGIVFIGSHSHRFAAVSMETGKSLWVQELGDRVESSACISPNGKNIVVGCYDGFVYVMDVRTGNIVWKFATRGQVKSSPCCDPDTGLVYIGSHDQHIYALNVEEQKCVWWRHMESGSVYSSPCCCPLSVFIGTLGGVLFALDPITGSVLWQQLIGKPLFSSPRVVPGGVAVSCVDGCMYAFSHSGQKMWTFQASGPIYCSPCLHLRSGECRETQDPNSADHGDRIVFGCHGKTFYCLDTRGKQVWRFDAGSELFATPWIIQTITKPKRIDATIAGAKSYDVGPNAGSTQEPSNQRTPTEEYDLNIAQCDVSVRSELTGGSSNHPNYAVVVVCTTRGRVCLLQMSDGELLGECVLDGEVFSSPVVYRGCIYVGCRDDKLYCITIK